jgi:hypothetical protein
MRSKLVRRILLALVLVVAGLAAVPGYWIVRARFFTPTFDVESIKTAPHYQDPALIAQAWELPVAKAYRPSLVYQSNGSVCGPASLANAVRSWGTEATESSILDGTGKCWTGFCLGGLTLDELADVARERTGKRVTVVRPASYEEFRELLAQFNQPDLRFIANFQRGPLFGKGVGHHSPIGGYLAERDLVLVLDVNREFEPWLVAARRLYEAMDTVDGSSGKKRGLLRLE